MDGSTQPGRVLIRPVSGWMPLNLRELWEYRELLYFLVWRDLKVRYKQTALGVAWVVLQPLFLMLVFTLFFGRLVGVPSDGLPYSIFVYTGILPWQLFSRGLNEAGMSLVANERVITKIYFPRILVPASAVLSSLIDFSVAFIVLVGYMLAYGIQPGFSILALSLFVLLAVMAALGVGLWLAALNVVYRDVRYTLPFLTQIWMFATPIIYPVSVVPEAWRSLYSLNPMVGVVEGFRWSLLGKASPADLMFVVSALIVAAVFIGGIFYFQRVEQTLADVI
ncbi:MAG: ABC-2 type transporter [Candidatus Daviesbacteria bacterium GW2011_GWA2_42_7]|uniref:Transport permease protein n=1 Tax=Candidatus Daviesbacteria bacterium GW2011_GWA2_42_7 TaxID=1618425 RepID=A0A0G1B6I1_9BACT|nr:MAG: ABC-2 type transporter [Candidatus Daviesbacteria bacterium GW2011_GWA2_42_7]